MSPQMLQILQTLMMGGAAAGMFGQKDTGTQDLLNLLQRYGTPEMVLGDAQKYYQGFLNSPAYARARSAVNISANQAAGQAASSIGMRGLSGSGIGSVIGALGSNTAGFKLADLQSSGWSQALQTAFEMDQARLGAAGRLPGIRNIGQATGAGLLDWLGKGGLQSLISPAKTTQTQTPNVAYGTFNPRPQGGYDPSNIFAQLLGMMQ